MAGAAFEKCAFVGSPCVYLFLPFVVSTAISSNSKGAALDCAHRTGSQLLQNAD